MNKHNKSKNNKSLDSKKEVVVSKQQLKFSGPIPPPQTLEHYKNILPDAPERIMSMAEKQQNHKHQTIDKVLKTQTIIDRIGQILGFIIVLLIIALCFFALYLGHSTFAFVSLIIASVPLAKIFVFNKHKK